MWPGGLRKWVVPIERVKVKCPYCGYLMPIQFDPKTAKCRGVYVRCKGRNCKRIFEVKINTK